MKNYLCRMVYRVIGTMSGSSMDGLDIAYCIFEELAGQWHFHIEAADCHPFDDEWKGILSQLNDLPARDLLRAHSAFGHWMGHAIEKFIAIHQLEHKVHLIASHGHTVFHEPGRGMTFQMGDGASIAAITKLPVVSDLRNMDVALGGQGAPIVPIGEKLLWPSTSFFLNIGGICNLSYNDGQQPIAFDICPANRVLDLLAGLLGQAYDLNGQAASKGKVHHHLLQSLNSLAYYAKPYPKSLHNEFGSQEVFQMLQEVGISVEDQLRTMCEHIADQLHLAVISCKMDLSKEHSMIVSGGGALNQFLVTCLKDKLKELPIQFILPDENLIQYKEALVMGLIGVLRWREEVNVLSSVTGALRSSVGGALWMGQD